LCSWFALAVFCCHREAGNYSRARASRNHRLQTCAQCARSRMSHSIQPSLADSSDVPYVLSTVCGQIRAKMRANTGRGSRLVQSRPGTLTRGEGGSVATPALRLELRRILSKRPMLGELGERRRKEMGGEQSACRAPEK
jgi:hypothetical protein